MSDVLEDLAKLIKGGPGSGRKGHKTDDDRHYEDVAHWHSNLKKAVDSGNKEEIREAFIFLAQFVHLTGQRLGFIKKRRT